MSMTSEMTRLAGAFEAAQTVRLSAIAAMRANVQRDLNRGRAERARTMAGLRSHAESQLKEIFGSTAVLRGAAADLMDGFTRDREKQTDVLIGELRVTAGEIHDAVVAQIELLNETRSSQAKRDEAARRAYLKALRRRVDAVLGDAKKFMKAVHKDRAGAERVWGQHADAAQRQRKPTSGAEPGTQTVEKKGSESAGSRVAD